MFRHQAKTMSDNEVILRLSTVVLLVSFLIYMQWERARKRAAIRRQFRRQFHHDGKAIDAAPLHLKLAAVRANYTVVAHAHARHLPFFRNHPAEPVVEHHTA
jgi:hypothetical protein